MYHCYQLLPSTVIKVGYKITILNNIINIFILFFSNLIGRVNKKNRVLWLVLCQCDI